MYPTETYYGLGGDGFHEDALRRVVSLKRREAGKPVALLLANCTMWRDVVLAVPPLAQLLAETFWPGPLTIVLPARKSLSPLLTGGGGKIGVRISSHPVATLLVSKLGRPLTSPSANPAGLPPPVLLSTAREYFALAVDCYLDGGKLEGKGGSSVVEVTGSQVKMIREGAISASTIAGVLDQRQW